MKTVPFFVLMSIVTTTTGCDYDRKIDLTSFSLYPYEPTHTHMAGFVITDSHTPFAIPDSFTAINKLSAELMQCDWIISPNYLLKVFELSSLLQESHLKEADVYIQALQDARKTYRSNMFKVNALSDVLIQNAEEKLAQLTTDIQQIEHYIELFKNNEAFYKSKISVLQKELEIQQDLFFITKRKFYQQLSQLVNNPTAAFNIHDALNFELKKKTTPECEHFWGDYELIPTSDTENCVYINFDQLMTYVESNQEDVKAFISQNAVEIWDKMTRLSGFYDPQRNVQFFNNNLQSQLTTCEEEFHERHELCKEHCPDINQLKKKLVRLKQEKQKIVETLPTNEFGKIDKHSKAFQQALLQKLNAEHLVLQDPLAAFIALYHDNNNVQPLLNAYAEKMIADYPAQYKISVDKTGTYSKPKVDEKHFALYFDINPTLSIVYAPTKYQKIPRILTAQDTAVRRYKQGVKATISQNLMARWKIDT